MNKVIYTLRRLAKECGPEGLKTAEDLLSAAHYIEKSEQQRKESQAVRHRSLGNDGRRADRELGVAGIVASKV